MDTKGKQEVGCSWVYGASSTPPIGQAPTQLSAITAGDASNQGPGPPLGCRVSPCTRACSLSSDADWRAGLIRAAEGNKRWELGQG